MGRYRDDLPDHEGYVLAELDRPVPLYAEDRWTSSSTPETREAVPTGRHRAACGCGWRGPISGLGIADIFLPDHLNDSVLDEWEFHTADVLRNAQLYEMWRLDAQQANARCGAILARLLVHRDDEALWEHAADAVADRQRAVMPGVERAPA